MSKKKQTDNEIIEELLEAFIEETVVEEVVEEVKEVAPVVKEVHPLVGYHKRGRSINQLAGMFMISEAEVKRILDENI